MLEAELSDTRGVSVDCKDAVELPQTKSDEGSAYARGSSDWAVGDLKLPSFSSTTLPSASMNKKGKGPKREPPTATAERYAGLVGIAIDRGEPLATRSCTERAQGQDGCELQNFVQPLMANTAITSPVVKKVKSDSKMEPLLSGSDEE